MRSEKSVLLFVLLAAPGCGSDAPLLPAEACTVEVDVAVGEGLTPGITWVPDCGVGTLQVTSLSGDGLVWSISGVPEADLVPTNPIHSGVVYGRLPPGTRQFTDLVPLQTGHTYALGLHVIDREGTSTLVGSTTFSP